MAKNQNASGADQADELDDTAGEGETTERDAPEILDDEQQQEAQAFPVTILVVNVSRDSSTTTPTTVYEHELPILELIHGEESVWVVREREGTTPMNAAEAHAQLLAKYRQHQDEVKSIYPSPKALQRASGLPYTKGDSLLSKPKASLLKIGGVEVTDQ